MVKRTITITTVLLILSMIVSLIIILNKSSFAADDDIASGTSGTCSWVIDSEGVLTISPTDGISGQMESYSDNPTVFGAYDTQITKVYVEQGVKTGNTCRNLFNSFSNCTEMDLRYLDTSNSTNMQRMFYNCSSLTSLDVSGFNTSRVTNMSGMFNGCKNLTSLNISNLNTSSVIYMSSMFKDCEKLTSLDVSGFNTSSVTKMANMFDGCKKVVSLDTSGFNTSEVTDMSYMFHFCYELTSLDVSNFNTSKVVDMQYMFASNKLTVLDVSGFNTSKVRNMMCMFLNCGGSTTLNIDVSGFDTSNVTSMEGMFAGCETITSLDLSGFNTSKVTRMADMFFHCEALTSPDLSSFDTSEVTSMSMMFHSCYQFTNLDLSSFDTSKVRSMNYMFYGCYNLTSLDLSNFDTSNVTRMDSMFYSCSNLTSLNISNFNTSAITDMRNMFSYCKKLTDFDVSSFDTSNVTIMYCMFQDCYAITNIDVSNFNTSKVTNMENMFSGCSALKYLDLSGWDTSIVDDAEKMFNNCSSLKSVALGENFTFIGNSPSLVRKILLPTPSGSEYTRKWIREDKEYGPYSAADLRDNYDGSTMAGTWIWQKASFTVTYNYTSDTPEGASELPPTSTYEWGEEVTVAPDASAPGYTFNGWSRTGTFEMPTSNVTITGSFTANTNTTYKVEHYLEDLNGSTYTLTKTDNLTGETDSEATATANDYEGFTFDDSIDGTKLSGNISADGSLVLKVYYKRNSYNVTYSYTGEIPNNASALPSMTSFRYGEEIVVADDASAEGYTFSGWIKDYINMPAHDIEITGYFIEVSKSYSYKVEYFFDGEMDNSLEEIMNAEKDEEISINPQNPLKHGEKNYTLVSNNHNITISINDEENVINVYYESDVLDYEFEYPEGDGIPDKYQIKIIFKVENGSWNDGTNKDKVDVITLYDKDGNPSENGTGNTKIPEVGSKPNQGYTYGYWNRNIPSKVSNTDDGKEYVYSYEIVKTIEADIAEGKGKLPNPKTDDIVNRYLLAGVGGIFVLTLVSRIRRRYSRKAKKIQF